MEVRADFPGGNVLVDRVEGDTVRLRQDRRTTTEWWFYWRFRVDGAAGRTVRCEFTDGDVFGPLGPCYSPDGKAWSWLGRGGVETTAEGVAFTHAFGPDEYTADFCFCLPYTQADLDAFLAEHSHTGRSVLCVSEGGRGVELLTCRSATGRYVVPLTARTHACETTANYVLEGVLDFWANGDGPEAAFLREHVDLRAVPFMDKDGVENGDQGKLRAPHDHNRDYEKFHYASSRAVAAAMTEWSAAGTAALALDLHCPWLRGGRNEEFFLVGIPEPWERERARFARILEATARGTLPYRAANDIAWGAEWNTADRATLSGYLRQNSPVAFAAAVECPYSVAGGEPVTPDGARGFGRDLARAIAVHVTEREAASSG